MTIRDYEVFCALFEEGSIRKAAHRLFLSQPTVSNVLRQMEQHFRGALFERSYGRLLSTELGKSVFRTAIEILELHYSLEGLGAGSSGKEYRIGTYNTFAEGPLLGAIDHVQTTLGTRISAEIANHDTLVTALKHRRIDFAVTDMPVFDDEIRQYRLFTDLLMFFCCETYECPAELQLGDLTKYPLITREKGTGDYYTLRQHFSEIGYYFRPYVSTASNTVLFQSVRDSRGIGCCSKSCYESTSGGSELRRIAVADVSIEKTRYLCVMKDDLKDRNLCDILNTMVHYLQSQEHKWNILKSFDWKEL